MRMTAAEVAACTNGELRGGDAVATGLSFDSRSVQEGQAFVAIVAERDGHEFVLNAMSAGASFAIVCRGRAVDGIPCVEVDDTAVAVTRIGEMCRLRLDQSAKGRIIGVTGSAGKTSTKDFILAVLRARWSNAHGAHLSFNNDLGVPVTLANAPDECPAVVLEMGMRGFGEITRLCDIARPNVGVVTIVGDAHGERVGGIEGVARAKAELVVSLPGDGVAVLNADDVRVSAMSGLTDARVVTFGAASDADVRFSVVSVDVDGCRTIDLNWRGEIRRVRVPLPGEHMAANASAAVAVGVVVGVEFADAVNAIAGASSAPGRMQWVTATDGTRILDDTYNANPSSMEAALRTLASTGARRTYAVLGEMAEISDPATSHREIAALCEELGVTLIALETAAYGTPVHGLASVRDAVDVRGADVAVLVKGSRAARTERAVDELRR